VATLRSTRLYSASVLSFLLAACGSDPAAAPASSVGPAPTVTSTIPASNGPGVALNVKVAATFSAAMDPGTITASTFTVQQGSASVPGTLTYSGSTATFTPASNLPSNTGFTATVSTGAKDLAGNALAAPYSWSFVTGTTTSKGPAPVGLGTAGNHVVLAKTAISSVPSSGLTGDIGLSPAAASFVTGFSLVADSTNVFSRSTQVVGKVFAANYAVPTPTGLTTAISNMESAYTDAAGRPTPDFLELGTGNIGGLTLVPGLYKWTSTVTIPADMTISGGANDVWIFQTTGDLTMAAARSVTLSGGAQPKNIFWQIAGQATLGANSHFEGVILSKTAVTLQTGATMNGRVLAQTQVALQQATITQPAQ
jgi:Ice-binding-like/Bacterial Ig-like domain